MDHQHITSLDEDSINFLEKHHKLIRTNYPPPLYSNNIRLNLYDLIDEKEFQKNIPRLIHSKEGLTLLKLLISKSSKKDIECFYEKTQKENIFDHENKEQRAVCEMLHQHFLNPNIKKYKSAPKVDLESLKSLKKMISQSLDKNLELLNYSKEEYRYCKEKVGIMVGRFKEILKEKICAGNAVSKIQEENKRIESLKKSLASRKNKLLYLKKRINLYEKYFDLQQNDKTNTIKNKFTRESTAQEKEKYKRLLDYYKRQTIEMKNILSKIPKHPDNKNDFYKRYSAFTEELSLFKNSLRKEQILKDNLGNEIKSLMEKIKKQKSDLKFLNKIIGYYYNFELSMLKKIDHTKSSLEDHKITFERLKQSVNRINYFDYDNNNFFKPLLNVQKDFDRISKQLSEMQHKNQKLFSQTKKISRLIPQGKKRLEKLKKDLSVQIILSQAMEIKRELTENGILLRKIKTGFDKVEINFRSAKKAKEAKLISLKELGEQQDSLMAKWQIFLEFTKEKVVAKEDLLMDFHEKLTNLRFELATNLELFEESCVNNSGFSRTIQNNYSDIASMLKEIWQKIQSNRESFEEEESNLNLQIKEQNNNLKKYKKFYDNFQKLSLEQEDVEILLYQHSDLEKNLNGIYYKRSKKRELRRFVSECLYCLNDFKSNLKNRLNEIKSNFDWNNLIPQYSKIDAFSLLQTGILVFLLLSCFSYVLIYKKTNTYNNKNSFFTSYLSTVNYDEKLSSKNKKIPDMLGSHTHDKKNLFENINLEEVSEQKVKTTAFENNQLNFIPNSSLKDLKHTNVKLEIPEVKGLNAIWNNYIDIFDDLRFDNPTNAFRLFEMIMNREVFDLTLMDSIQLLYMVKGILESEEGPFFDRLFNDFVVLGFKKKEAALNIIGINKIIEKNYGQNIHYIFKGKIRPIAVLEEMNLKDFEKIISPYIISHYKIFAKIKNVPVPENIQTYAKNLAQDIYACAKKFRIPVTSLLTIAHQETFFVNMLGDNGKSASPFQIYQTTKLLILKNMNKDGFQVPTKVSKLENHTTFAAFMAAYYFAELIRQYAVTVIDPFTHKPTTLIINLDKSTKSYNGGGKYNKEVLIKQLQLGKYLKGKIKDMAVAT